MRAVEDVTSIIHLSHLCVVSTTFFTHRYALMDEVEKDLVVMGVTAIEDKLQDGVPETLASLREAGVKVWMLTGDKVDTAINIGHSARLLSMEMKLLRLCGEDGKMAVDAMKVPKKESIEEEMKALIAKEISGEGQKALIVDTYALAAILKYELHEMMVQICKACCSVVCARVSPKQKASVVEMVKKADPTVQTLSIGDGANDVPMIQVSKVIPLIIIIRIIEHSSNCLFFFFHIHRLLI